MIVEGSFVGMPQRTLRNTALVAEYRRTEDIVKSRARPTQSRSDLPTLIESRVGEHMQKLEDKLLSDLREMGRRAVEESSSVLTGELNDRIDTLEEVAATQSRTLTSLRDSSKVADHKVNAAVTGIEDTLARAVPGFRLEPPAKMNPPSEMALLRHRQFDTGEPAVEMETSEMPEVSEFTGKIGFCPTCTSTKVRRAKRSGMFEEFLRLFSIAPFRCRACRHKFYRF